MPVTINGTSGSITGASIPVSSLGTHGILQIVSAEHSTQVSTSSTSYVATNLTVNITPSSTSNKILVMTSSPVHIAEEPGTDAQGYLSLERDSTSIATAIFGDHTGNAARADDWSQVSLLQLDAPSTTSQIAYNVKIKSGSSGWTAEHCTNNFPATIVCMEIKA